MRLMNLLVVSALLFGQNMAANGQTKLNFQIKDNETYLTEQTSNVQQTLSIGGMNVVTTANTQTTTRHNAGKRDGSGQIEVKHIPESLQINMTVMGSEYSFDSNNPDKVGNSPLEAIRPVHKAIAKNETTLVFDKNNKVTRIQFKDDILGGVPDAIQRLVRKQLDPEEAMKKANQELGHLPDGEVRVGEKWTRTESTDFGGGQVMTFQVEYTYAGPTNKDGKTLEKVTQKISSVMFDIVGNDLPLTLKDSKLKVAESDGTMLFDRSVGRPIESRTTLRVTGDLTFDANGTALPSKLDLKLESSTVSRK